MGRRLQTGCRLTPMAMEMEDLLFPVGNQSFLGRSPRPNMIELESKEMEDSLPLEPGATRGQNLLACHCHHRLSRQE